MKFSTLTIDKKSYRLLYDFNDIADCEVEAGCNLLDGLQTLGQNSARQLRGLLYAMTRKTHSDMTLRAWGELVRFDTLPDITTQLGEACSLAVSEEYAEKYRQLVEAQKVVEIPVPESSEKPEENSATESGPLSVVSVS